MKTEGQIRAVAFQEGDVWVIHGVEFDVVAQAKDLMDAPAAFLKSLISTMLINQRLGRNGLEKISAAPERYLEMFENATVELKPLGPMPTTELKRPNIDLRGYRPQQAAAN